MLNRLQSPPQANLGYLGYLNKTDLIVDYDNYYFFNAQTGTKWSEQHNPGPKQIQSFLWAPTDFLYDSYTSMCAVVLLRSRGFLTAGLQAEALMGCGPVPCRTCVHLAGAAAAAAGPHIVDSA